MGGPPALPLTSAHAAESSNYPVFKAGDFVSNGRNGFVLTSSNEQGGVPAKKRFPEPIEPYRRLRPQAHVRAAAMSAWNLRSSTIKQKGATLAAPLSDSTQEDRNLALLVATDQAQRQ